MENVTKAHKYHRQVCHLIPVKNHTLLIIGTLGHNKS